MGLSNPTAASTLGMLVIDNRPIRVLFLCTHNSARSILAEALANHLGAGRIEAFSAGSQPSGRVNPHALATLEQLGVPTLALRSKSWDVFSGPDAPPLDLVVTVCANAANEPCPAWVGAPQVAHWEHADPSITDGGEDAIAVAFLKTAESLRTQINRLLSTS